MSGTAEAYVILSRPAPQETLAAIKQNAKAKLAFEALPGRLRILASAESRIAAMRAATLAALTLIEKLKDESTSIESVRPVAASQAKTGFASRGSLSKEAPEKTGGRVKPRELMGEVSSPMPSPDQTREAFRTFMTSRRLRPTTWAKDAGISSGEILGFLTGRSRGLSAGVAEKLAAVARVQVEDMFR